jgi:hypothetical protein
VSQKLRGGLWGLGEAPCGGRCAAIRGAAPRWVGLRLLADRSSGVYPAQALPRSMKLANPTPERLSQDLLRRLDVWRGDAMSRGTAIRLLLEQALVERKA